MIYLAHPDIKRYKSFVIDSKDARKKLGSKTMFHFDRRPYSYLQNWQALALQFTALSSGKKTAIPDLTVRNGRLFLTQKSYEVLHGTLSGHGEFLPVTYEGGQGYLFNILSVAEMYDGVDIKQSTRDQYGNIQSIVFNENKIKNLVIFRTEFDAHLSIYCSQTFKDEVEKAGLQGLAFSADLGAIFPKDDAAELPAVH